MSAFWSYRIETVASGVYETRIKKLALVSLVC